MMMMVKKKLFQQFFYGNSLALKRTLLFSTQAPTTRQPQDLHRMIVQVNPLTASVVPILENWVQEGNQIEYSYLKDLIDHYLLCNPTKAHQMLQWMCDKGGYQVSELDLADQIEYTSSVNEIEDVERYLDAIPHNLRGYEVYFALLSAYVDHKCIRGAEDTLEEMRELGLVRDALPYNVMLSFYYETDVRGYADEMGHLAEDMREEGVDFDKTTYNILLKAYGENLDMNQMKLLVMELEDDPLVNMDWYHYLLAAQGYWYAGCVEKSLTMLNKSEEEGGYSLHKDFYIRVYVSMIKSLCEKDDMDVAERIWEEWFSKKKEMHFAIRRAMIDAYGRKCQWEKAEAIVFRMTESGIEPDEDTLHSLASAYVKCNQMDKAVETSMKAISMSEPGRIPNNLLIMTEYFKYLERQGNDVAKEELYKMLKEHCGLPEEVCHDLKKCHTSYLTELYLRNPKETIPLTLLRSDGVILGNRPEFELRVS